MYFLLVQYSDDALIFRLPFEYWSIMNPRFYSRDYQVLKWLLHTGPFGNPITFDHLKIRLVQNSDPTVLHLSGIQIPIVVVNNCNVDLTSQVVISVPRCGDFFVDFKLSQKVNFNIVATNLAIFCKKIGAFFFRRSGHTGYLLSLPFHRGRLSWRPDHRAGT